MARRCSSCAKKRTRVSGNKISNVIKVANNQNGVNTLNVKDFKQVYYIGDDNIVPSSDSSISYGVKQYGQRAMVHKNDLEENPDLWSETLPVSKTIEEVDNLNIDEHTQEV